MYGLIGYPLSHSFSRDFFTKKFQDEKIQNAGYWNFPIEDISEFPALTEKYPGLLGLNVTIPYKEKIIPYLDHLDEVAAEIGAVNTIRFQNKDKKKFLTGFNTDAYGFKRSLDELLAGKPKVTGALVLGTGGASKAIAYSLKQMNIPVLFVSSSSKSSHSYENLSKEILDRYPLVINTSPLGMYPKIGECPAIPYDFITSSNILFDLVYNPSLTLFLKKGLEKGAAICNGLKMLEYQALKSWEIWNENNLL